MKHRHDSTGGDRQLHPGQQSSRLPHYAAETDQGPRDPSLYEGLPSLTNRAWGEDRADDAMTYGYRGQGGYGDFTTHQGRFGESQGPHAQSGHGRGGVEFGGHPHEPLRSRGVEDGGHRGRGPRNYVRSDERIADDIIDRLTDNEFIDASEILVMVEGGLVTLTGNVPERHMKHRAEDIAAAARGVREVRNEIRVDPGVASFGHRGEAIRSGRDQLGSGFSSSDRPDPVWDNASRDSNWPGY
jgi:hypothetical protein